MKGPLVEGVLALLLRDLYVHRRSGTLRFRRDNEQRSIQVRKGHIIHAETNVREDQMGEVLVRSGVLTSADLKRATGFALRDRKRLGEVLVEQGFLRRENLEDALALHVHEVLAKVFSWRNGQYEFTEEGAGEPQGHEITLKVSTGQLILDAARSLSDPEVVNDYLGDTDRTLMLSQDPLLRFQRVTLTPADGYVLSRVDDTCSARDIIAMSPLPPEETQRSLFALLSTGMVEYPQRTAKTRPRPAPTAAPAVTAPAASAAPVAHAAPAAPAPTTPAPGVTQVLPSLAALMKARASEVPVTLAMPSVAPPAAPPAAGLPAAEPEPPAAAPSEDPRRLEILEMHAGLATRTYFEVLGVARDATEAQVREAYFRLARRFHPDVHHDPALADLRDSIETIFIRLGEAYETLRNPRIRASYEAHLGREQSEPAAPAVVDPKEEARQAEEAIRRGARSVAEERYWEAIQTLEPAILRAEGPARQRGRVLLARAYAKNVHWVKQGEELLLTVLREDPPNVEALMLLADIYRSGGLKARTAAMLRKVLEIEPGHEEAAASLEALAPEEPAAAKRGLLKKIFRG